ncbi:MAG: hypothetical protein II085_02670 [Alphaproteobacteria bacterium]|nr:hypothetical protein [Alphaproteobacteria bacterium]
MRANLIDLRNQPQKLVTRIKQQLPLLRTLELELVIQMYLLADEVKDKVDVSDVLRTIGANLVSRKKHVSVLVDRLPKGLSTATDERLILLRQEFDTVTMMFARNGYDYLRKAFERKL